MHVQQKGPDSVMRGRRNSPFRLSIRERFSKIVAAPYPMRNPSSRSAFAIARVNPFLVPILHEISVLSTLRVGMYIPANPLQTAV